MRLRSLTIDGFHTFTSPTSFDFRALGPGVFAVRGGNGVGKTAFLEACWPAPIYRKFPSRAPSTLMPYAHARGGTIDLQFEYANTRFRASVAVKGGATIGATMYKRASNKWIAITSGKTGDYDAFVLETFGPESLLYVSSFGRQDGGGTFQSMGATERRNLFRHYLGLERYQRYHEEIAHRMDIANPAELTRIEATIAELRSSLEASGLLLAKAQERETAWHKSLSDAEAKIAAYSSIASTVKNQTRFLRAEVRAEEAVAAVARARANVSAVELTEPVPVAAPDEASATFASNHLGLIGKAEAAIQSATAALESANREMATLRSAVRGLNEVPCHGEGIYASCPLIAGATTARKQIPVLDPEILGLERKRADLRANLAELEKGRLAAETTLDVYDQDAADYRTYTGARASYATKKAEADSALALAESAATHALAALEEAEAEVEFDTDGELIAVDIPTDDNHAVALELMKVTAEQARDEMLREGARISERIALMKADLKNMLNARKKVRERVKDYPVLETLAKACSPTGLPIFETDGAGPEVCGLINNLLDSSFDSRFRTRLATTAEKKSGGTMEEFNFVIEDGRYGEDRSMKQLSGGEQTIVGEATQVGFSIYQARRKGTKFETMFRDEPAGNLTEDNVVDYIRMLCRAREIGGFHQVFFISHFRDTIDYCNGDITIANGNITFKRNDSWLGTPA